MKTHLKAIKFPEAAFLFSFFLLMIMQVSFSGQGFQVSNQGMP